jgi:hypothetical protein
LPGGERSREAGKQQEKQAQATLAYNMRAASRKAEELRARLVAAGAAARRGGEKCAKCNACLLFLLFESRSEMD